MFIATADMKTVLLAIAAAASSVLAQRFEHSGYGKGHHFMPGRGGQNNVSAMGNATFTQLIDHNTPELGTFEQVCGSSESGSTHSTHTIFKADQY